MLTCKFVSADTCKQFNYQTTVILAEFMHISLASPGKILKNAYRNYWIFFFFFFCYIKLFDYDFPVKIIFYCLLIKKYEKKNMACIMSLSFSFKKSMHLINYEIKSLIIIFDNNDVHKFIRRWKGSIFFHSKFRKRIGNLQ